MMALVNGVEHRPHSVLAVHLSRRESKRKSWKRRLDGKRPSLKPPPEQGNFQMESSLVHSHTSSARLLADHLGRCVSRCLPHLANSSAGTHHGPRMRGKRHRLRVRAHLLLLGNRLLPVRACSVHCLSAPVQVKSIMHC